MASAIAAKFGLTSVVPWSMKPGGFLLEFHEAQRAVVEYDDFLGAGSAVSE
jgi:hypothetical protein